MKKIKISKKYFIKTIIFSVCLLFLVLFYLFGWHSCVKNNSVFEVRQGETVSSIAKQLYKKDLIDSIALFKLSVRGNGGKVQTGKYEIPVGTSVWRIARKFATGDIATVTVVIPEGTTIKQIKEILLGVSALTGSVECGEGTNLPICNLQEGDLFPDTYRVAKGTSRLAFLDLMRRKMEDTEKVWEKTGRIMPKTLNSWNDIITLASIVQKETPKISEMPVVASVYLNRLEKNMRLQADPTVVYAITNGLGDMRGNPLLLEHLKVNSPYNTYIHYGLPPTPIANVGLDAIKAVMQPADTNYLFFVADGNGGHKFAKSYEEHMKNQAVWRSIKKMKIKN